MSLPFPHPYTLPTRSYEEISLKDLELYLFLMEAVVGLGAPPQNSDDEAIPTIVWLASKNQPSNQENGIMEWRCIVTTEILYHVLPYLFLFHTSARRYASLKGKRNSGGSWFWQWLQVWSLHLLENHKHIIVLRFREACGKGDSSLWLNPNVPNLFDYLQPPLTLLIISGTCSGKHTLLD